MFIVPSATEAAVLLSRAVLLSLTVFLKMQTYIYHQKTVVLSRKDSDSGKRRVEAFVGGLDLTDGRCDKIDLGLFRSIMGVLAPPDFWQTCALQTGAESGPREPRRGMHSKVTGAAEPHGRTRRRASCTS